MKKIFLFVIPFFIYNLNAQSISNRIEISGKIVVEGLDLEDITIYNKTSNFGTVSDINGNFNIPVKISDTLEIRALQYQDFDIIINESVVVSKRLSVFLIQEINQLEEIVIGNQKFSGELALDLKSIKTFKPKMNSIYFAAQQGPMLNENSSGFTRDDIAITNLTAQNKPLVNGLNIVNVVDQLLLPLFRSEVKNKKKVGIPEVPVEAIKYYFGSEFLSSNFNVPKHRVEEFIRYVERKDFDFTLLNYGRELEFLELLNQKSILFLNENTVDKD